MYTVLCVYSVYILTLLIIIVISYYQVHAIDDVNMTTPSWPHPSPCLVGNTGLATSGTRTLCKQAEILNNHKICLECA